MRYCLPLTLVLLAFTPISTSSQIVSREGLDVLVLRMAEIPRTEVAFGPMGEWVVARGTEFRGGGISREMRAKLREYVNDDFAIDAVAFTPGGGWTVVADETGFVRGVGGDYLDTLDRILSEDHRVRAVAFNPTRWRSDRGFVIAYDGGYAARSVPREMRRKLDEFTDAGKAIRAVAFTPDGGWTIVVDDENWTRSV